MEASFPLLVIRCVRANKDFRSCNNVNTLSLRFDTVFGIHLVVACMELDPGIHVTYAFSFAFKTGCDKMQVEVDRCQVCFSCGLALAQRSCSWVC